MLMPLFLCMLVLAIDKEKSVYELLGHRALCIYMRQKERTFNNISQQWLAKRGIYPISLTLRDYPIDLVLVLLN